MKSRASRRKRKQRKMEKVKKLTSPLGRIGTLTATAGGNVGIGRIGIALAGIVLAGFICYAGALKNPFIWDDEKTVVSNDFIRDWKNAPRVFTRSLFGEKLEGVSFYRPLQSFSYFFDYALWNDDPAGYHLTNLILHILNGFLIFFIFKKLPFFSAKNRELAAFFTALLFVIHPVQTEAVVYVSGRGDILAVLFALCSFLFFLKNSFVPVMLFYILAILSKENIVIFPLIPFIMILLYRDIDRNGGRQHRHWEKKCLAGLFSIFLFYAALRIILLKTSSTGVLSLINEASFIERAATFPRILLTYIRLAVFPVDLHMEYHFVEKSILNPYVFLGMPILISALFFLLKTKSAPVLFALGWFAAGLLPFNNVFTPLHSTLREHWLYFSMIGFSALTVFLFIALLNKFSSAGKIVLFLCAASVVFYFVRGTMARSLEWKNPIEFYRKDLSYEPESFLMWNNLGVEYWRRREWRAAAECFTNAINVSPGKKYGIAYNNLGVVYEATGEKEKALGLCEESIRLSNYNLAYGNLGRFLIEEGRVPEAREVLEKGISYYPQDAEIRKQERRLTIE